MAGKQHDHNGTIISNSVPSSDDLGNLGYAILPVLLAILFFIYFVASGKLF